MSDTGGEVEAWTGGTFPLQAKTASPMVQITALSTRPDPEPKAKGKRTPKKKAAPSNLRQHATMVRVPAGFAGCIITTIGRSAFSPFHNTVIT